MSPSAAEIEAIVRKVLGTLMASDLSVANGSEETPASNELVLTGTMISSRDVTGRLQGQQILRVPEKAVITPAVRDLCREAKVTIVRGEVSLATPTPASGSSTETVSTPPKKPQRLIVAGSHNMLAAISKQLCSRQSKVLETCADDTSALHQITNGLRDGHQAGVLIAKSPFAVSWQAARDEKLRPVVVGQWSELTSALKEVPANLLILGADRWNVASACNAARFLFEHLKRNS
ncbi:hypothetical protein SH449x_000108 [Pirellulaceae bacterium SH449]